MLRSSRRPLLPLVALAAALLPGCVADRPASQARTPWEKLERVLAIDFSHAAAQRKLHSLDRAVGAPAAELRRTNDVLARLEDAADEPARRLTTLAPKLPAAIAAESHRGAHLAMKLPTQLPAADEIARTTARNLERLGLLLGLERRPLPEPSDPEYRTDPYDDRPVAGWWQRLSRRIFP